MIIVLNQKEIIINAIPISTLTPTIWKNRCNKKPDTLTLIVTSTNSCFPQKDSANLIIHLKVITGIENISNENLSFSPNPFCNQLSIETDKASSVKITNISGIEVYNGKLSVGKSLIDTNTLSSGVYFITITNEETAVTKKLMKE